MSKRRRRDFSHITDPKWWNRYLARQGMSVDAGRPGHSSTRTNTTSNRAHSGRRGQQRSGDEPLQRRTRSPESASVRDTGQPERPEGDERGQSNSV